MLAAILLVSLALDDPADLEFFERDVRPLLVRRCVSCHGPEKQKGDLRLDSRAVVLKGGKTGPAIVPGKVDESLLIEAINYGDLVQMPPKSKLPAAEIATLTRWVERGAAWPIEVDKTAAAKSKVKPFDLKERSRHWSFQPVRKADPPEVKDASWPSSPIDRFLLASLEAKGLKPARAAEKRTLIRRATFDLTGLPPTPAEIDAFLADAAPDAFSKVVDRLLASPRYGERWGRHWLDLVRYAETSGHEFDYDIPDAWRYRDYVVRAFNDDLPYDQFLTEHVAGDLLAEPRRRTGDRANESILATGFYFLGEGTHSPVDVREDEVARIDNQIDVLSKTFLGLTVACARCHDHKFDAIPTKDYYALAGYMKSSRFQHAIIDDPARFTSKISALEEIKSRMRSPKMNVDDATFAYLHAAKKGRLSDPLDDGDILFDDFEGDRYENWTAQGKAFGDGPIHLPLPDYQGDVKAHGRGLVGSHNGRLDGSVVDRDALTGTLTSRTFKIEKNYIHFLIGGGSHQGKTCVNLQIDGKTVKSLTGRDANPMRTASFDVRPFRGRSAQIQVVDDEPGPWGNISLDHVVFSDQEFAPGSPSRAAAASSGNSVLDPQRRARWVRAIASASSTKPPTRADRSILFEDFNNPSYAGWTVSGPAFGDAPTKPGSSRVGPSGRSPIPPGIAHSGLASDRLQGVLRSRSFRIDKKYVHVLASGKMGRLNVIVDGFEKNRDPIYGGLLKNVDDETPRWITLDVGMWVGHRAYLELSDGASLDYSGPRTRYLPGEGYLAVDEIRFSDEAPPASAPVVDLARLEATLALWKAGKTSNSAEEAALQQFLLVNDLVAREASDDSTLVKRYREIEAEIPTPRFAPAILDGTGEDEHVLIRGSAKTPGELVPRRFLEAVGGETMTAPPAGSGRLELAERMLDPSCPMTARVMVNRLWKGHFGVGLVKTPDDFGVMGDLPSHPELLDWLAAEFVARKWSIKSMHREMMLTTAYRMSSEPNTDAERTDGSNRLLHRMNVRRLEAESVRDSMLFVSGRLDAKMGGPGVPPHLTPLMDGRGRPDSSGPVDGDGRRSIYLNIRRNFLPPMLLAFDFPAPATTMGRRNTSNVPAQALTMLDDPFVLGQARLWAERILAEPGRTTGQRISAAYATALGRPPSDAETADALLFLQGRETDIGTWTDLTHVLFNVKEFLFIP